MAFLTGRKHHDFVTVSKHGQALAPNPCQMDCWLVEPWRNMAKSIAGFLGNPTILFAMFFDLGINTIKYRHQNSLHLGGWAQTM
jgi:hypothetical protein